MEFDRTRFRLAVSIGCIAPGLKVAACLLSADLGNSFVKREVPSGGDVKGVS